MINADIELSHPCGVGRANAPGAKRRIGIVDLDHGFSGITRYLLALLREIDREEFDVVLFCRPEPHYRDLDDVRVVHVGDDVVWGYDAPASAERAADPPRKRWSPLRWLWRRLSTTSLKHTAGFIREARRLAKLVRKEAVDLLHVQVIGDAEGALAGSLAGVPRIIGTYNMNTLGDRRHRRVAEILTARSLSHAVFVSDSTMQEWRRRRRFDPDRVSVILNGVDVPPAPRPGAREQARQRLNLPLSADPVIATVGRLAEQKGHRYLLEAAVLLKEQFPNLHVVLAGDGVLRQELESMAGRFGLASNVTFLGHCTDVQPVFDAADVFVLPSLWEAMPFALLEAAASALPLIATPVAGVPELVEHGVTGLLTPPADGAALADNLRTMLALPDRGASLAAAVRQRVDERYSSRVMLQQTIDLYRQLLSPAIAGPHCVQSVGS